MKRFDIFWIFLCVLISTGCVKRSIIIQTDPPAANVWINEHLMGRSPVTYEFITHGRYKFQIEKNGFQPIVVREMVRAPIYQWIPLDFIFEWMVPVHLEDKHSFRYVLRTQPPAEAVQSEPPLDKEQLAKQLKNPDWHVRRETCVELAIRRDPSTDSLVVEALQDPHPFVRAAALNALRSIQGEGAINSLLNFLHSDPSEYVRWQAAIELEALKSQQAVPGLIAALKDRNSLVRTGAAEALAAIPDKQSLKPLVAALKDKDTSVRRAATEGLGKIDSPAAVPALIRMLSHHDVHTRRKAAEALRKYKSPSAGRALVRRFDDWDPKVRSTAIHALIECGDKEIVPMLIRYLRAFNAYTREDAALTLAGLKDPRAVQPLQKALIREWNGTTRNAMKEALQEIPKA